MSKFEVGAIGRLFSEPKGDKEALEYYNIPAWHWTNKNWDEIDMSKVDVGLHSDPTQGAGQALDRRSSMSFSRGLGDDSLKELRLHVGNSIDTYDAGNWDTPEIAFDAIVDGLEREGRDDLAEQFREAFPYESLSFRPVADSPASVEQMNEMRKFLLDNGIDTISYQNDAEGVANITRAALLDPDWINYSAPIRERIDQLDFDIARATELGDDELRDNLLFEQIDLSADLNDAKEELLSRALADNKSYISLNPGNVRDVSAAFSADKIGKAGMMLAGGGLAVGLSTGSQDAEAGILPSKLIDIPQGVMSPDYVPERTQDAYKLFRTDGENLYPLFVDANTPVPVGDWQKAIVGEQSSSGKVKSKIGDLAFRPGWHAGDNAAALHIGGKSQSGLKAPDTRLPNQVWAEVSMADDLPWQDVANAQAQFTKAGKPIARTQHITDGVPYGGSYRYKTNSNMEGEWLIGGDMRVNRVLSDEEVADINASKGYADLPRQEQSRLLDQIMERYGKTGYLGMTGNRLNVGRQIADAAAQGGISSARALALSGQSPEEFYGTIEGQSTNRQDIQNALSDKLQEFGLNQSGRLDDTIMAAADFTPGAATGLAFTDAADSFNDGRYFDALGYGAIGLADTIGIGSSLRAGASRVANMAENVASKAKEGWLKQDDIPELVQQYGQEVQGYHYSRNKDPMRRLDGTKFGTGHRGADYERVKGDPDLAARSYIYPEGSFPIPGQTLPGGESMVDKGATYKTLSPAMYDITANPAGFTGTQSEIERQIKDAGFEGYVSTEPGKNWGVMLQPETEALRIGPSRGQAEILTQRSAAMADDGYNITAEYLPSVQTPVGRLLANQPPEVKEQYTDLVQRYMEEAGIFRKVGAGDTPAVPGYGAYQGAVNPNYVLRAPNEEQAKKVADTIGYLTRQDAVPFYREGGDTPGIRVTTGRPITPAMAEEIYKETGHELTRTGLNTVEFLDYEGKGQEKILADVQGYLADKADVRSVEPFTVAGEYNETKGLWDQENLDLGYFRRGLDKKTSDFLTGQLGFTPQFDTSFTNTADTRLGSQTASANKSMLRRPAGRLRERLAEEGDYQTIIEGMPQMDALPLLRPDDLLGGALMPTQGDRTAIGELVQASGIPLSNPLTLQGGPQFPSMNPFAWASSEDIAMSYQDKVRRVAEAAGTDKVFGLYSPMGLQSSNYSTMPTELALRQIQDLQSQGGRLNQKMALEVDKAVRAAKPALRDFPGILSPDAEAFLAQQGEEFVKGRKVMLDKLSKAPYRDAGFPLVDQIYRDVAVPSLLERKIGEGGDVIMRLDPRSEAASFTNHRSYNTSIPGSVAGRLAGTAQFDQLYPAAWGQLEGAMTTPKLSKKTGKMSKPRLLTDAEKINTVAWNKPGGKDSKSQGFQMIDEQYIDYLISMGLLKP